MSRLDTQGTRCYGGEATKRQLKGEIEQIITLDTRRFAARSQAKPSDISTVVDEILLISRCCYELEFSVHFIGILTSIFIKERCHKRISMKS